MNSRVTRERGPFLIAAAAWLLIVAALAALIGWQTANELPAGHDAHSHLRQAIRLADYLLGATDGAYSPGGGAVKYPLLTPLLTAALFILTNDAFWSCLVVTALFCLLALAALVVVGRRLAPQRFTSLLPPAALLAAPSFWEIGFSYNLESGLLAAAVVGPLLLLRAERRRKPWAMVLAASAIAVLAQSKLVLLLFTLPAAVPWCLAGSPAVRRRRLWLTLALVGSAALWLTPHLGSLGRELLIDYRNPTVEVFPGPLFYLRQSLFNDRGLPLALGLAALLVGRMRRGHLRREDAGFLGWLLIPLLFFSAMETKRAWYLLPAYPALSAWFLFALEKAPARRWSKTMALGLTVLYLAAATFNLALVARQALAPLGPHAVAGIRPPEPPGAAERELADLALDAHRRNPLQHIVVDVSAAELKAPRLETLWWRAEPTLAGNGRLAAFGPSPTDVPRLVRAAADAYQIFAVNKDSLRLDCGEAATVDCPTWAADYHALAAWFAVTATDELSGGDRLTVFTRRLWPTPASASY